jgi:hypothetical protein
MQRKLVSTDKYGIAILAADNSFSLWILREEMQMREL